MATRPARAGGSATAPDPLEALRDAAPGHVETVRAYMIDRLSDEQIAQLGDIAETIVNGLTAGRS